jgi:tetratricopeptide (TPR) repeat protein
MKSVIFIACVVLSFGCADNTARPTSNAQEPARAEKLQSTTVHTTEGQVTPPAVNEKAAEAADNAKGGRFSASGNPIDTEKFDKAIADAEAELKEKSNNAKAKEAVVNAYFERGFALTEARQYAAALADYRRALKLDPNHEESKKWEEQIIGIYNMMKKEYPKPGEEPPPLPFKKDA